MKRTGTAKRHKIKQVLTTLLVFAVLVGVVPTVTVSASVPADIIPPLHVLLPHMGATAGQPFRIGAEAFRNHLQKNIAENTGNPQIKIDGNRALYTLRSNNAIQIGEYIFPYFDFGRRLDFQSPHPIGYIVPFLISNGDLFLESVNNNSGASTIIYAGYRLTVNTSFSFTGLNASTSTSISTSRNVFLFSTVIRAGEFNTNAITEYFSSTNEILRRTVGSNTEWLNVTQLLRNDIAQGQLSSVNNAKLSVSQLTATRQVEYGTKAFSIPRDFVTRCGLTFWQYIRTLEPHALYTQSPENSEHELVLPDWLRELLEKLGERDEIEFIICPDGGGVTYNITNNYGGGSSHGGDCCCCETRQEQTGILRAIIGAITAIPQGIGNVLTALFVPREDFLDNQLATLQSDFDERLPIVGQLQAFFDELIERLDSASTEPPSYEIDLLGNRVNVFNTKPFEPFMPAVHGMIIVVWYYGFGRRIIRRLSKALGGIER